jgi:hypothetical protein
MIGRAASGPSAICAISLGIVGRPLFDRRQGRNQIFNSAGNIVAAVSMRLLGYFISSRTVFFFVSVCTLPTILALLVIHPDEIDYERARGAKKGDQDAKPAGAHALLKDRPLVIFLVCAVMFHFANAAMLPLLGEMLAKGQGRNSMMFMSACVVTTQLVITLLASASKQTAWSNDDSKPGTARTPSPARQLRPGCPSFARSRTPGNKFPLSPSWRATPCARACEHHDRATRRRARRERATPPLPSCNAANPSPLWIISSRRSALRGLV